MPTPDNEKPPQPEEATGVVSTTMSGVVLGHDGCDSSEALRRFSGHE